MQPVFYRLTAYRPPFEDELLYGWMSSLASANYISDIHGIQSIVNTLFPYSKRPEHRETVFKDPIRVDFIKGLSENVKNIRALGYRIPDVDEILAYHTPIVTLGIAKNTGEQARYIHTACASVSGDIFDMPKVPQMMEGIRICPACLKEERYIRTWHQFPGVTVCARHGTSLHEIDLKSFREQNVIQWNKKEQIKTDAGAHAYARYVKEIYDHPSDITLTEIYQDLMRQDDRPTFQEAKTFGKKTVSFEWLIRYLMEKEPRYRTLVNRIQKNRENTELPEGTIRLGIARIADFRCPDCGHVWTDSFEAVKLGLLCPFCMGFMDPDKWMAGILKSVGDGRYKLTEPFRGMGATQEVLHETCGGVQRGRLTARIWQRTRCQCEQCNSVKLLQKRVDAVTEGYTVLDYIPTKGMMHVRHDICGKVRNVLYHSFLDNPHCPDCKVISLKDAKQRRLLSSVGAEYEIVRGGALSKQVMLRHKPCGTQIKVTPGSIIYGNVHCPICVPYRTDKRDGRTAPEGELYMEIQEWFKSHKLWISKRHNPSRIQNIALQILVKKGFLYRVEYGIYSNRNDLTVYEIAEEMYLRNDDGTKAGQFTGDTARYLAGEITEEPVVITLESARVSRYTHSTTSIHGRQVQIRGIVSRHPKPHVE